MSNASDAIDKLCYRSLTDEQVGMKREDFAITIRPDQEARTLTVSDNGIGMNDTDLEQNLGVIASSGTFQFRQELDKDAERATLSASSGGLLLCLHGGRPHHRRHPEVRR